MADLLKFTVDGRELQARPGSLLIEACRASGIEVPSFCYYPGLSLQAACRMCLVEVEKAPKLQTACTLPVAEGMVVRTATQQVADARRSMLELLLGNHPLDCPVCDKGGECELQDMVFRYGAGESRFAEEKRHVDEQQWSPVVYFDAPRCILCYRCVRVCDEGMGVGALGVLNRGANSEITPNHGDHLDCEECGMCIDICPVGALTSGAYRYKARPWEIQYVSTTCAHCGDGCRTTLSVRNNSILRGNNRDHSGVNGEFLCIKGRYAYDFVEHPDRLKRPLIRKGGVLCEASWDEALRAVASHWKQILERHIAAPRSGFGVIGSNHTTNEASYLLQRFARTVLRTNNIDHRRTADFPALMSALAARRAGRTVSLPLATSRDLKSGTTILLIGGNPTEQHPLLAWNIREGVRLAGARLYVVNSHHIPLIAQSAAVLPVLQGHLDRAAGYLAGECDGQPLLGRTPGERMVDEATLGNFREKLRAERDVIIVLGPEISGPAIQRVVRLGDTLQGRTSYILLSDYSNSRGAADMGMFPSLLPGYRSIADSAARDFWGSAWGTSLSESAGLPLHEMLRAAAEGSVESLYIVGANPLGRASIGEMTGKTFLVVQDLFLHETARAADVVLPAASAYECEGTVTSTCGELQWRRKAVEVAGARPDVTIIAGLAGLLGAANFPARPEELLREISRLVPGYEISPAAVMAGGASPTQPDPPLAAGLPDDSPAPIEPAGDNLFTSGTLGKYSGILSLEVSRKPRPEPALL